MAEYSVQLEKRGCCRARADVRQRARAAGSPDAACRQQRAGSRVLRNTSWAGSTRGLPRCSERSSSPPIRMKSAVLTPNPRGLHLLRPPLRRGGPGRRRGCRLGPQRIPAGGLGEEIPSSGRCRCVHPETRFRAIIGSRTKTWTFTSSELYSPARDAVRWPGHIPPQERSPSPEHESWRRNLG